MNENLYLNKSILINGITLKKDSDILFKGVIKKVADIYNDKNNFFHNITILEHKIVIYS